MFKKFPLEKFDKPVKREEEKREKVDVKDYNKVKVVINNDFNPRINSLGKSKVDFRCGYCNRKEESIKGKLYEEAVQKLGSGLLKHKGRNEINGYKRAADAINSYVLERLGKELIKHETGDVEQEDYYILKAMFYEEAIKKLKTDSMEFIELLNTVSIANAIEGYVYKKIVLYYEER